MYVRAITSHIICWRYFLSLVCIMYIGLCRQVCYACLYVCMLFVNAEIAVIQTLKVCHRPTYIQTDSHQADRSTHTYIHADTLERTHTQYTLRQFRLKGRIKWFADCSTVFLCYLLPPHLIRLLLVVRQPPEAAYTESCSSVAMCRLPTGTA